MYNLILIFVFLLLGIVLQKVKRFPSDIYKVINNIVIYFCLPALALYYIPKIKLDTHLLYPIGVTWISFTTAILFFSFLRARFKWSKKLTGCLILTAGFGNTSFLGFPIIQALYGEEGLKMAILVDQPGTFVVLSTLGVIVATLYSTGNPNGFYIAKKIILFPPFIAFLLACFMNVFHFDFHHYIQFGLLKVGSLMTPLAMLSVGLQLHFDKKSQHWKFLRLGLAYKLLFTPALIYLLYVVILDQHSKMIQVSVMEAAMAPMISASIIASSYGLKPKLCSMMIGFGIPISFVTLIFWYFVMQ
ncbi:AEC family transporter [Flavobacterium cellulosilyticum]|uniref:AEC family transporter n=1 Tax=Flavobacterium cellulosilyticum TaxID=2541731 RepID=A0A4R5CEG9_9FLAO|nr:AEC family transporter [Flavobacterium cellulosilyticum]TDD97369.1 AEC family transporter [Flavobacterium cellulosilyticum]